jgi:hypothetical protein
MGDLAKQTYARANKGKHGNTRRHGDTYRDEKKSTSAFASRSDFVDGGWGSILYITYIHVHYQ